jgi:hypothetical protein
MSGSGQRRGHALAITAVRPSGGGGDVYRGACGIGRRRNASRRRATGNASNPSLPSLLALARREEDHLFYCPGLSCLAIYSTTPALSCHDTSPSAVIQLQTRGCVVDSSCASHHAQRVNTERGDPLLPRLVSELCTVDCSARLTTAPEDLQRPTLQRLGNSFLFSLF